MFCPPVPCFTTLKFAKADFLSPLCASLHFRSHTFSSFSLLLFKIAHAHTHTDKCLPNFLRMPYTILANSCAHLSLWFNLQTRNFLQFKIRPTVWNQPVATLCVSFHFVFVFLPSFDRFVVCVCWLTLSFRVSIGFQGNALSFCSQFVASLFETKLFPFKFALFPNVETIVSISLFD